MGVCAQFAILIRAASEDLSERVGSEASLEGGKEYGHWLGRRAPQAEGLVGQGPEVGASAVLRVLGGVVGVAQRHAWRPSVQGLVAWRPVWRSLIQLIFHWETLAVAGVVDCRGEGRSRSPVRGPEPEASGRGRWGGVARCWAYGSFPMEVMDWMWSKKESETSKMTFKDWGLTLPLRGPFWFLHSEPWHHIFYVLL